MFVELELDSGAGEAEVVAPAWLALVVASSTSFLYCLSDETQVHRRKERTCRLLNRGGTTIRYQSDPLQPQGCAENSTSHPSRKQFGSIGRRYCRQEVFRTIQR